MTIAKIDIPSESMLQGGSDGPYLDPYGPTIPGYRTCSSMWSFATGEEIKVGLAWWLKFSDKEKEDKIIAGEALRAING